MPIDPAQETAAAGPLGARWAVILLTALAYALVGALALGLAGPPGYASPLYPSAGIALAAVLCYGRSALAGVALGSFAVNAGLGALRGQHGIGPALLPLLIGVGAALQAGVGAALVRRYVAQPLVLSAPHDILRFGLLGALVACCVSPSLATPALLASGLISADGWPANWLTWWLGDSLGVLIGTPLALTLVGRPRVDWRSRRFTLGLPLLLALAVTAAGMLELQRLERQRVQASFERDADRLASAAEARLALPLHALQALHSVARMQPALDSAALRQASAWWLSPPHTLQAMGYSEWVGLTGLPAFEARAHVQGLPAYRVFDRDGGAARAGDRGVVALRLIEPPEGNLSALGVNALSIPAARAAILASRRSSAPAATAAFVLTQSAANDTGVVIYQALFADGAVTEAARQASFRGVVFVTLRTEAAMAGLATASQAYLRWCLLDADPQATLRRLAGPAGCDQATAAGLQTRRTLTLAERALELRIAATAAAVPGHDRETAGLLALSALGATVMLGALLLTITGQSRRTEVAVQSRTADLRREIRERTAAEAALRDSEQRLRSILDHAPTGVMFLDRQGGLIEGNPRLATMLGCTTAELRGRSVLEIVHEDERERVQRMRRELMAGADSVVLEPLRLRGSGAAGEGGLEVRATASALRSESGEVVRMVGVVQDITEHLRLLSSEQALHRAEAASRAKSEFVSRMSHELRTPLNAMIGFAQLLGLDREPELPSHQREWTQQIQRAGWHLLEMINETLDLARIESGAVQLNLAAVALPALVAACRAMVAGPAKQRELRISETYASDATAAIADATRLKQILTNLLSNAVKYNCQGGEVRVVVRRVGTASAPQLEIAVADTGLGMTPEQQASLFQPYNRLGRDASGIEGTGIGLVISRRLAELMQGTLEASSAQGQGSTFTLRLPAADAAEQPALNPAEDLPPPYQQRLVHYVEDNETNIEVMRGIFAQRPQIRLEVSMLGLDGLTAIRASRPDLVLLDMQLPDISGLELLRHLKQDDTVADIPVVVVSADATPLHTERALTSGALHYVTKPLDVARFLQTVDAILEGAQTRWG